jgi:biopolymer transport protein ExbD
MRIGNDRRQDDFEINVIPLIDVLLTLLMFFVLTSTFVQHTHLQVTLPRPARKIAICNAPALTIMVDRDGHFYVGSDEVMGEGIEPLKQTIATHRRYRPRPPGHHPCRCDDSTSERGDRDGRAGPAGLYQAVDRHHADAAGAGMVFLASRPAVIASISPGVFIAVLTAMGGMLSSLKRLSNVQSTIQTGISAAENLFALIDTPPEVDHGTHVLERTRGDLHFDNVGLILSAYEYRSACCCRFAL